MSFESPTKEAGRVQKGDVAVQVDANASLPEERIQWVQVCNKLGLPAVDNAGNPIKQKVNLSAGQLWIQASVTNHTRSSIRLVGSVARLIDPQGNIFEPLARYDVKQQATADFGCPTIYKAVNVLDQIPIYDYASIVPPGATYKGWLVFPFPKTLTLGDWKAAFYDVPTKVNEKEELVMKENFEIILRLRKFMDYYEAKNAFSPKHLVRSEEITK